MQIVLKLKHLYNTYHMQKTRERSGSVVECLTRDRGAAGSSLTGVTVLCPWAKHINPSLVLVQPRKTPPYITERLSMGRKESKQNKTMLTVKDQTNKRHKISSVNNKCAKNKKKMKCR